MSTAVQRRRGTTAQHASFAGLEGELTVDTTKDTLVIHDGSTAGGRPLLREDQSNLPTSAPTTGIYNASGSLAISTSGTGKLFVNASGNVSIGTNGTSAATETLCINGFAGFGDRALTNPFVLLGNTGSGAGLVGTYSNHALEFRTNNSERLRITSAGLVGVGTGSPPALLSVHGTGPQLNLYGSSTGSLGANFHYNGATGNLGIATNGVNASTNPQLLLDLNGRLGVGTTSPSSLLHVAGSLTVNDRIFLQRASGSLSLAVINYWDGSTNPLTGTKGDIVAIGNAGGDGVAFVNANTERMRLTSTGLGIGTSSPGQALDVVGTIQSTATTATGFNQVFDTSGITTGRAQLRLRNSGGDLIAGIENSAGNTTLTGAAANSAYIGPFTNNPFYLVQNGVIRATVTSTGLGIGTTSPQAILSVSDGTVTGEINPFSASSTCFFGTRTNHPVSFQINASEKVRIDTSGRLLVGTSSARTNFFNTVAGTQLQVEGTTYQSSSLSLVATGNNSYDAGTLVLGKGRGNAVGSNTIVQNGTPPDILGYVSFQGNDGSEFVEGASIKAEVDGAVGANDLPSRLVFSVTRDSQSSPTEALRITNGGETRIFCVTTAQGLIINHSDTARNVYAFYEGRYSATDNTGSTGTRSYVVYTSGDVRNVNNSYGAISDIKLKENIVDANSQWDDLKALQVRNYNFKEGQTHTQIGLVAQEVELVSPGLVTESPDRDEEGNDLGTVTKSVNYSVLYMKAVKALQEAMERIEQLEAAVTALQQS